MADLRKGPVLEEEVGELLRRGGRTIVLAESCTGGLIGHRLTAVPGSSDYFLGGFVTYSNRLKESVLGVGHGTLEAHGAVSAAVAREMAGGARNLTGADYSLAVTGIAGPSGGTEEKPVGLVYVALEGPHGTKVAQYRFQGDRDSVKQQAAEAGLEMLREYLGESGGI